MEIVVRQRVKGGWGEFVHLEVEPDTVGTFIRTQWGKTGEDKFTNTPIGGSVMVTFYGTFSQIALCYKLAGDEIYKAWCEQETRTFDNHMDAANKELY